MNKKCYPIMPASFKIRVTGGASETVRRGCWAGRKWPLTKMTEKMGKGRGRAESYWTWDQLGKGKHQEGAPGPELRLVSFTWQPNGMTKILPWEESGMKVGDLRFWIFLLWSITLPLPHDCCVHGIIISHFYKRRYWEENLYQALVRNSDWIIPPGI